MTNLRPGGRLLCNHHGAGTLAMNYFVQLFQERNRFQVLAPAKLIRDPLAFLAAVVEIEHGCHCINAQTIKMKLLEPVERVREQEVAHFVAAIVENVSAPIGMLALARVEMFVKRGAVKTSEGESIFGKMRGHPIHDDANAALVQIVDQITKIVGRSVTRRGSVVVADLVPPRRPIRMLLQRQELDMG